MSHYFDWTIEGFYDGKVMLLKDGISAKDCVFLDMEIARADIRSIGHHMLLLNKNRKPVTWDSQFKNCIQPNNLREYDGKHDFRLKYPLATIHLLMCVINEHTSVILDEDAIPPLYFTDGVFNVLFGYPENVLNWLNYLQADKTDNPLNLIFENKQYTTVIDLMKQMNDFFRKRDAISVPRERGDRIKISTKDGAPFNVETEAGGVTYKLNASAVARATSFLELLSAGTKWTYKNDSWS
ncbi:MAG: hypothetical protein AAB276_04940, partial [Pseudomonadota bacterium]